MSEELKLSIFKTLAYFDLLNFPLTKEELFRYLWMPRLSGGQAPLGYVDFTSALASTSLPGTNQKYGYYFLSGREEIVETRRRMVAPSELKLTKARLAAKFIRAVPFLRAIFVCNSVGAEMARNESDIDFFIVADKNRIWLVRFFTNFILRLFGLRTYGQHEKDRVCLSFYVDVAHLDLAPWRVADDDIHFAYWLQQMLPIYDPENYYQKFLAANSWTKRFLPNMRITLGSSSKEVVGDGRLGRLWKRAWETMWRGAYGDLLERQAKDFQWLKLKPSVKEKSKLNDNGVVIKEGIIKLHEHDARRGYREKWLQRISNI